MKQKINIKIPAIIFILTFAIATGVLFSTDFFLKKPITTQPRAGYTCPNKTETVQVPCTNNGTGTMTCTRTFEYIPDDLSSYQSCIDRCNSTFKTPITPPSDNQQCIDECAPSHCYTGRMISETCGTCNVPEDKIPPPPPPTNTPIPTNTVTPNTPTPTATGVPNTPTPTATGVPNSTPTPTATGVPNTPTPTSTGIPNSPTPTITLTPAPNACGYTQCDSQHPCSSGLVCVTAKNDKSYCAKPEYQDACKNSPSTDTCCKAAPAACGYTQCDYEHPCTSGLICTTAKNDKSYCAKPENEQACKNNPNDTTCCSGPTPTEIVIAKGGPTNTPPPPTIPSAGVPIHWAIIAAPILLVALGLIF